MPNSSSTTVGGSRRGGPTFKFYWVENGQIVAIKRYDEAEPQVVPYRVFKLIRFVFPHFKTGEHVVKFQDDNDLIELIEEDCIRFNAESGDLQVYLYIFPSKEEALRTVTPPTGSQRPLQFVPPSFPTEGFITPMGTPSPQIEVMVSQPQVTSVPQPQVETTQPQVETTQPQQSQARPEATHGQSNPEVNNSPNQGSHQEAGDQENGHAYVVCDGCNGNIPTHRYKCLQCRDFDLCATCESTGMHPEHLMIRVPLHFVHSHGSTHRDVLYRVFSAATREVSNDNDIVIDLGKQLKDALKMFGVEVEHLVEGKHCDSRRKRKGKHCPLAPVADNRRDLRDYFKKCRDRRDMREEARTNHGMESQSGPSVPTTSAPSATTATNSPVPSAPSAPILIPNPAHVPAPTPTPVSTATAPTAPPATVTDSPTPIYPLLDISEVVPMEEDSPRPGEWLMVDSDGASAVTAETPAVRQPESSLPFLHSDDVANVALEKLAMMGYQIDDPLLVHLVEDCKGDIIRILDCLHG